MNDIKVIILHMKGCVHPLIIDFDGFLSAEKFQNEIMPLMKNTNTAFSYYKEDFELIFILEKQPLFFVFLTYVPNGHHTAYPTLAQSMRNENGKPRQSVGEWVVDTIFQTRQSDAKMIFEKIEKKDKNQKIIPFIREELYRIV